MSRPLSPFEAHILEAVDTDWLLDLLDDLVAIRSLDGQESPAQRHLASVLEATGLEVDCWPIDIESLSGHPAFGVEVERDEALGVVGCLGGGDGPTLILNGHVDVVPAGDESLWRYPPWRATVADGHVYGRGALDMKGGLCCAITAARALVLSGVSLHGRLLVQCVIGEEDGGLGTLATVLRGYTGDGAIVCEPTELQVVTAQAGALNFRLTVPGRSAHGCVRDEGVSAIEKFDVVHRALLAFEAERNAALTDPRFAAYGLPIPLSIGTLQAGDWASTVPERLTAEGRFGIAVGEAPNDAKGRFESVVASACAKDAWLCANPVRVDWWGGQFHPAQTSDDAAVVTTLIGALEALGGAKSKPVGVPYGADMRLLVNEGSTPTVLFGPGDVRNAHAPDEYVPIVELTACARALALTAYRFLGR